LELASTEPTWGMAVKNDLDAETVAVWAWRNWERGLSAMRKPIPNINKRKKMLERMINFLSIAIKLFWHFQRLLSNRLGYGAVYGLTNI